VSFELKVLFLTVASTAYYVIILSTKKDLFMEYGSSFDAQLNGSWNCSRWDRMLKVYPVGETRLSSVLFPLFEVPCSKLDFSSQR